MNDVLWLVYDAIFTEWDYDVFNFDHLIRTDEE